jgi:integrase/recombinase XerD
MWQIYIKNFKNYLTLERALSENSIEAYIRDVSKFWEYLEITHEDAPSVTEVSDKHIFSFFQYIDELGLEATSQARMLSGLKAFYKYLEVEDVIKQDPTLLIASPKVGRKLPSTLSYPEIVQMLETIDLSTPEGTRNRAMLEVLYSSGLRVSELVDLKISECYFDIGFIRVRGKGDKVRLVPIGRDAMHYTQIYMEEIRKHQPIQTDFSDHLFKSPRKKPYQSDGVFDYQRFSHDGRYSEKYQSPHLSAFFCNPFD